MSKFYAKGNIYAKCDSCGKTELVAENQTDRLLANDYFKENNWKTIKTAERWINVCPECISALESKKRDIWVISQMGV